MNEIWRAANATKNHVTCIMLYPNPDGVDQKEFAFRVSLLVHVHKNVGNLIAHLLRSIVVLEEKCLNDCLSKTI